MPFYELLASLTPGARLLFLGPLSHSTELGPATSDKEVEI